MSLLGGYHNIDKKKTQSGAVLDLPQPDNVFIGFKMEDYI